MPRVPSSFNDSCSSPLVLSLHQPLLPAHKVSPVRVEKLRQEVLTHPVQPFVTYVLDGLQNGFLAGFNPASVSIKLAIQNIPSGSLQPSVIDDYLHTELALGSHCWSLLFPPLPHLHISLFGVIPPKKQPGHWCLILVFSSPDGHSVDDRIRKDPFMVHYIEVDAIIDGIMFCSAGVLYLLKSLMRKVPIALFLYTPMIVIFLACSGKTITLWSWPCLLVYVQRLTLFLQLQTWRSESSRKSMT